MNIKQYPNSEKPYEKLELYGEKTLSNAELLAIIIKTGTKDETSISLANKVLNLIGEENNLSGLSTISIESLKKLKGIGRVKAIQIKAVVELSKRLSRPINTSKMQIKSAKDVANILMQEMQFEKREIAKLLILNVKNIILKIIDISLGGTNFVAIEPKTILYEAIQLQAARIILVHNHPSGDIQPSADDINVTKRLYEASKLVGIELLDHIIIGNGKYDSIKFR